MTLDTLLQDSRWKGRYNSVLRMLGYDLGEHIMNTNLKNISMRKT